MIYAVLLAEGDLDIFEFLRKPGSAWVEILFAIGVMFVVTLLVFIWAAFWRNPRKRRHVYHHAPADGSTGGLPRRRKRRPKWLRVLRRNRRRRRRRRGQRQANPTLSQVGGLPPPRRDPPPGP